MSTVYINKYIKKINMYLCIAHHQLFMMGPGLLLFCKNGTYIHW